MCNREAPGVEQFARANQATLTVVGVGTQDTFPEAREFHDKYDITFDLLWDPSFETWQAFGITSQPAAVLVTPRGKVIQAWQGAFPEDQVVELANGIA